MRKSVAFDPSHIQHSEAVWLEAPPSAPLPSLAERLSGHESGVARVSLSSPYAFVTDGRVAYCERRVESIRRHGGQPLLTLESSATMYGLFAPSLLTISSWPDAGSLEAFEADDDLATLRREVSIADVAYTRARIHPSFHSSPSPFSMDFDADSTYELCALWRADHWSAEREQAFFESVVSSRTRHQAGEGIVLSPFAGDYVPDLLCLSQWPSLENFAGFVEDPEHEQVSRARALAFSRMDATATRLFQADTTADPA